MMKNSRTSQMTMNNGKAVPAKHPVRRVIDFIIDAMLVLFLSALVYVAVSPRYSVNYISSASMFPYLHVGAMVITDTEAYDYKTTFPETGDVIVYYRHNDAGMPVVEICHRMIEHTGGGYITKGDNNTDDDAWTVTNSDIVGKVVFHTNLFAPLVKQVKQFTEE